MGHTVDVFSLHGVSGMIGLICNSLFTNSDVCIYSTNGAFSGNPELLGKMIAVICVLFIYITIFTLICLGLTSVVLRLQASGLCCRGIFEISVQDMLGSSLSLDCVHGFPINSCNM